MVSKGLVTKVQAGTDEGELFRLTERGNQDITGSWIGSRNWFRASDYDIDGKLLRYVSTAREAYNRLEIRQIRNEVVDRSSWLIEDVRVLCSAFGA